MSDSGGVTARDVIRQVYANHNYGTQRHLSRIALAHIDATADAILAALVAKGLVVVRRDDVAECMVAIGYVATDIIDKVEGEVVGPAAERVYALYEIRERLSAALTPTTPEAADGE